MKRHQLPELPYAIDALAPGISARTIEYHYGKHHAAYIDKLNDLIENTEFESATLEEIVKQADGALYDHAAQVWNHNFYWNCLHPEGGGNPEGNFAREIEKSFDSIDHFRSRFMESAGSNFGSGWTWLVRNREGRLEIVNTANAGNPLTDRRTPLLACDVWEHAYYLDYQNRRGDYLDVFWKLVNWDFVTRKAAP